MAKRAEPYLLNAVYNGEKETCVYIICKHPRKLQCEAIKFTCTRKKLKAGILRMLLLWHEPYVQWSADIHVLSIARSSSYPYQMLNSQIHLFITWNFNEFQIWNSYISKHSPRQKKIRFGSFLLGQFQHLLGSTNAWINWVPPWCCRLPLGETLD